MDHHDLSQQLTEVLVTLLDEDAELGVTHVEHVPETGLPSHHVTGIRITTQDKAEYIITIENVIYPKWLEDAETYALMHEGER